mmetsp:Transcript_17573/g.29807  ORF Transcript_17573/g.29807 Transcript_17573/m.29807 type:complete len:234 (-) Transcript_17573:128-829(-)
MMLTTNTKAFDFVQSNLWTCNSSPSSSSSSSFKTNQKSKSKNSSKKSSTALIITPAPSDVICGRGKLCAEHPGNREFRRIVESHLDSYAKADSKLEKSLLVSAIVNMVRGRSQNGGFLKRNSKSGAYEIVSDRIAREKVGQMLRDALHTQYKSSTEAKRKRRLHEMDLQTRQMKSMILRNKEISEVMSELSDKIHDDMEDNTVEQLFDRANFVILAELKRGGLPLVAPTAASE